MSVNGDRKRINISLAKIEAMQCQDLLSQAEYHVARARKMDNDEYEMRRKLEEEREAFRVQQIEDLTKVLKQQEVMKKEMLLKRQEYKEKTKNAIVFDHLVEKPKSKEKHHQNNELDPGRSLASEHSDNRNPRPSKKRYAFYYIYNGFFTTILHI